MIKLLKISLFLLFLLGLIPALQAQKVISGQSAKTRVKIEPVYERGIPPNLYLDMNYEDPNSNGFLEANESWTINLSITNKGKGKAQGLVVEIEDDKLDKALEIAEAKKVPYLLPDQNINLSIPINAGFFIKSAEHKLKISVSEHFGYDMDPAYLILNTLEFQEPELVFAGVEVVDAGIGTSAIKADAQIQPGEAVKVKIMIQNVGQNVSQYTKYNVYSNDQNIYIDQGKGDLGEMAIGEVKEFWITVSPNKRVSSTETLPIFLAVKNLHNRGNIDKLQLPLDMNQKPPQPEIVQVKADVEMLERQKARFETSSNKITANVGNIIDIKQVTPSQTIRKNAVAVVIGIEDYEHFAPAPYAANDARIMKDYFKNVLGIKEVYVYKNEEVDGHFFDNTFNPDYGDLQKAIIKGETELFVYYSGHGMPSKDGQNIFLFPSDGRIEALEKHGYDINEFYRNLEDLEAKSITIFLDACFTGTSRTTSTFDAENLISMKGVSIKPKVMEPWESNPNFTVFASSGYEETSLGFDPTETGLFTYYLCAGLKGNADDNGDLKITARELSHYISQQVKETSAKIHGLQTPQFHGNEEIILSEY